jgi:hypothetical protein
VATAHPLNLGDELRDATAELHALGIDDEVVFIGTADEVIAWLEADEPCTGMERRP